MWKMPLALHRYNLIFHHLYSINQNLNSLPAQIIIVVRHDGSLQWGAVIIS